MTAPNRSSDVTLRCAHCGSTELEALKPLELSAAELLQLAQVKLLEEQQQQATPERPERLPVVLDDVRPASVPQVIEVASTVDALEGSGWDLKEWLLPKRWVPWRNTVPNVRCEVCGEAVLLEAEVRWLPKDRAPNHAGLTMHVKCWERAQRSVADELD